MLVKGKKGASSGCFVTKNLFMYSDKEHKCESDDIKYIYENGDFIYGGATAISSWGRKGFDRDSEV